MDRDRVPGEAASGGTTIVLGLAILFAYLFLVALYESWNIPIPAPCRSASACSARSPRWRSPD
jgi:hypothetical protein